MKDVSARGDYFAMNCSDMQISDFELAGNYSFDGVRNGDPSCKDAVQGCLLEF